MVLRRVFWAGLALVALVGRADASLTITFNYVGNDVVATASGSLITAGLDSPFPNGRVQPFVNPGGFAAAAIIGSPGNFTSWSYNAYFRFGNPNYGTGFSRDAASGDGPIVGFSSTAYLIFTPSGYVSGDPIQSSSVFKDVVIAGGFDRLGLTPGSYRYSYSAFPGGPIIDTITVQVNAATPEPASLAMLGVALAGVGLVARRGRGG